MIIFSSSYSAFNPSWWRHRHQLAHSLQILASASCRADRPENQPVVCVEMVEGTRGNPHEQEAEHANSTQKDLMEPQTFMLWGSSAEHGAAVMFSNPDRVSVPEPTWASVLRCDERHVENTTQMQPVASELTSCVYFHGFLFHNIIII